MHFPRCPLLTSLLVGVGLIAGCGETPKTMRNMQTAADSKGQANLPLPKGNRPRMPPDPPAPKAPP
jgi:hypothetical protein